MSTVNFANIGYKKRSYLKSQQPAFGNYLRRTVKSVRNNVLYGSSQSALCELGKSGAAYAVHKATGLDLWLSYLFTKATGDVVETVLRKRYVRKESVRLEKNAQDLVEKGFFPVEEIEKMPEKFVRARENAAKLQRRRNPLNLGKWFI